MTNCGTCKFWQEDPRPGALRKAEAGRCQRATQGDKDCLMFVSDDWVGLWTSSEFSCSEWLEL